MAQHARLGCPRPGAGHRAHATSGGDAHGRCTGGARALCRQPYPAVAAARTAAPRDGHALADQPPALVGHARPGAVQCGPGAEGCATGGIGGRGVGTYGIRTPWFMDRLGVGTPAPPAPSAKLPAPSSSMLRGESPTNFKKPSFQW